MLKKLLGAFAVVALTLVVASSASALTVDQLKALGLTDAQAAAIAAMLAPATTGTASFTYTRDLTIGSTGSDVVALQDMLIASGDLVMPAGVSKGYFGAITKSALAKWQAAKGVSPASGYFGPITRSMIPMTSGSTSTDNDSTSSSSTLKGGNGDIQSFTETTSNTETTVGEGKTESVIGAEIKADDNSDLEINSMKIAAGIGSDGSTRLNRYADSFEIVLNGKVVGSADASDFSRNGATSTATIALKNAIIEAGEKERLYVQFVAADNIDSDDQDNSINVSIDRVRFTDASGFTTDANPDETISANVTFEDATDSSDAKVQSSSDNPDATILKTQDTSSSDEYAVFAFKIKTGSNSDDVDITSLPIALSIYNSATSSINTEDLITDMYIEVDGRQYSDYSISNSSIAATSPEVATSTFTIDEGDLTIKGDDSVDAVVYVKFGRQSGRYAASGTTLTASVTGASITAENANGDTVDMSGTVNGKTHTANISAATVDSFSWSVGSVGTYIDFFFTVSADDEDFAVLQSSIASSTTGTATTSVGTLSFSSGDTPDGTTGSYTVLSGDTTTFRIRYDVSGTNGKNSEVKITNVAGQEIPANKQISPTATLNVQAN
jgi:hypothetical protein